MTHGTKISSAVHRVRSFLGRTDMTLSEMARRSGIARSTLADLKTREWRGNVELLEMLEASVIPPDWQVGDPAPGPNPSNTRANRKEAA